MKCLALLLSALAVAACGGGGTNTPPADGGLPDGAIPPAIGNFPAHFLWGAAIAPYQAEGHLHGDDWYQWENGLCQNCSGDHADDGPDFWDHYETDFANAQMMHNNTVRIGIDWSRVFPTAAQFASLTPDPTAVQHYHDILASAIAHGLSPMVTLHHFATPTWLLDLTDLPNKRGWEDPMMIDAFAQFAGWCATEYGAQVDWWVTLNEPMVYIGAGYFGGAFPPGKALDITGGMQATWNMIDGHARAYDAIHANDIVDADGDGAPAMVSIAQHDRVFLPSNPMDPQAIRATTVMKYLLNTVFVDGIVYGTRDLNLDMQIAGPGEAADPTRMGRADYLGINYYGVSVVVPMGDETNYPLIGLPRQNDLDIQGFGDLGPITDFGWTIYPSGFRQVLDEAATYHLPIVITENGLADLDDNQRPRFLIDHLYVLGKAIDDGIDIRGYYHWALMDNFEWASGYCPAFGLFHVDFGSPDRTRTAGEGVEVYRRIIDANTVPPELFGIYPRYPPADHYCTRTAI